MLLAMGGDQGGVIRAITVAITGPASSPGLLRGRGLGMLEAVTFLVSRPRAVQMVVSVGIRTVFSGELFALVFSRNRGGIKPISFVLF